MTFIILNIICFSLVTIGAINWGLVGIFNWNLVEAIFGGYNVGSIIVYIVVFVASLWLVFYAVYSMGRIDMKPKKMDKSEKSEQQ